MKRVYVLLIAAALIVGTVGYEEHATPQSPMVAAGGAHTVGLRSEGTVVVVGRNQ